ncbi:MAG: hypothetical protein RLN76_04445 [Phycisphaeraceae bacterium]
MEDDDFDVRRLFSFETRYSFEDGDHELTTGQLFCPAQDAFEAWYEDAIPDLADPELPYDIECLYETKNNIFVWMKAQIWHTEFGTRSTVYEGKIVPPEAAVKWIIATENRLPPTLKSACRSVSDLTPSPASEATDEVDQSEIPKTSALTRSDRIVLVAIYKMNVDVLVSISNIEQSLAPSERLSPKTIGKSIKRLIDRGLVERPEGTKSGARLTIQGRRKASEINTS